MTVPPAPPPTPGAPPWFSEFLKSVLAKSLVILGANAPGRSYVSTGTPIPDCGQLTVHADRFRPSQKLTGSQTDPRGTREIVTVCDVIVTYYRCVTTLMTGGAIPDADVLDADGVALSDIGATLWFGLIGATLDGTLFPALVRPAVLWRDAVQINPQSGLAGWRATMEVTVA